jgi:uncharacterized repeat protein (TIGR01451 family)
MRNFPKRSIEHLDNITLEIRDDHTIDLMLLEQSDSHAKLSYTLANPTDSFNFEINLKKEDRGSSVPLPPEFQNFNDSINNSINFQVSKQALVYTIQIKYPHTVPDNLGGYVDAASYVPDFISDSKKYKANKEIVRNIASRGVLTQEDIDDLDYINQAEYGLNTTLKIIDLLDSLFPGVKTLMPASIPSGVVIGGARCNRLALSGGGDINAGIDLFFESGCGNSHTSQVRVAHDPNIKHGPSGFVAQGEQLEYKVEYENEGEGSAFGVYVTDRLDENLDESTLEIGPMVSTIDGSVVAPPGTYDPNSRTVTWFVGEVGPHEGGVADLSVTPKTGMPDGTTILNYATVYFPSVPEATKTNVIVTTLGIPEPIDTIAPTTTSTLSGNVVLHGLYYSDVEIGFTAVDDTGGTGVQKTEYSLDGGATWLEYASTSPIVVTEEGEHTIWYRSTDWFGNVEEAKSTTFEIVTARGLVEKTADALVGNPDKDTQKALHQLELALSEDKFWLDRNTLAQAGGESVLAHINNAVKFLQSESYTEQRAWLEAALAILMTDPI